MRRKPTKRCVPPMPCARRKTSDRKSTRLNSSHGYISYAVFCLKKKKKAPDDDDRLRLFYELIDGNERRHVAAAVVAKTDCSHRTYHVSAYSGTSAEATVYASC